MKKKLELNKIHHGDCFEVMRRLPKESIDLFIADMPYNIAEAGKMTQVGAYHKTNKEAWGDKFEDNMKEKDYLKFIKNLGKSFHRIGKKGSSIILFYDRGKPYLLKYFYEKFSFKNMICFVKNNPLPHMRKNNYRSGFEMAAWFSKGKPFVDFLSQKKMINVFSGDIGCTKKTKHPTEKYSWMIEPLILRHSKPGDVVLDPFLGSGTTAIAALKYERNFIGIDKSREFFEMSSKRVLEYTGEIQEKKDDLSQNIQLKMFY